MVALVATALLLAGTVRAARGARAPRGWQAVFGDRARAVADQGEQRVLVVLSTPSLADRIAATAGHRAPARAEALERRGRGAQRLLLAALRKRGVAIRRDQVFTRTFNGFSAVVTPRALAELERSPRRRRGLPGAHRLPGLAVGDRSDPHRVRPRRRPPARGSRSPASTAAESRSRCSTAASTGVIPYLRGRVQPRVRPRGPRPRRRARADDRTSRASWRRTARAWRASWSAPAGPPGCSGVAPGARVLPIRMLGWEQTADGCYALLGRGDLLLAGLERAVDPDRDGDVEDRARIALAAVVEPYAAFADSPEARAVAGATSLGTLVVAAAGNDGPPGRGFGTVGAPAAAPRCAGGRRARHAARGPGRLHATLSAAETRSSRSRCRCSARRAGDGRRRSPSRLCAGPRSRQPDRAADARRGRRRRLADFFDPSGISRRRRPRRARRRRRRERSPTRRATRRPPGRPPSSSRDARCARARSTSTRGRRSGLALPAEAGRGGARRARRGRGAGLGLARAARRSSNPGLSARGRRSPRAAWPSTAG